MIFNGGFPIKEIKSLEDTRDCDLGCNIKINKEIGILIRRDILNDTCELDVIHPCFESKTPMITKYFIVEGDEEYQEQFPSDTKKMHLSNPLYFLAQEQFGKMFPDYKWLH